MAGIGGYGSDPGNDAAADDDILNAIRAVPISMPASLRGVLPWHPVGEPQDPSLRHMSVGVAWALRQLMIHEAADDWIPPILDEATCPVCRMDRLPRLTSIQWVNELHDLPHQDFAPPLFEVQELVWTLVVLLDLGTADLVMAFYMLELCARAQRGLFKPNALRRLLIGCCVIARKLNTDDDVNLRWCQPRLELAFTAICLPHLAAIERQVLLLVETEGLPIDPQPYMTYATALWDSASLVLGVQPAPPEIFAPFP